MIRTALSVVFYDFTGTARPKDIDANIFFIDMNVNVLGLRHHGDRRRRGMDTTAGFRRRNPLNPVNAGFEFQPRENTATAMAAKLPCGRQSPFHWRSPDFE